MRFLRLLIWDALYCILLSVSYSASSVVSSDSVRYAITLLTCILCGAFLSHLPGRDILTILFVAVPGLYLALAPVLAPFFAVLPFTLPFNPVPSILLASKTASLRYAGALAAGYTIFYDKMKR